VPNGAKFALNCDAIAKNLDELRVYQQALRASDAISALLRLPTFSREFKLSSQLGDAADSVPSNIASRHRTCS
jgi:four helix bundle protein